MKVYFKNLILEFENEGEMESIFFILSCVPDSANESIKNLAKRISEYITEHSPPGKMFPVHKIT